MPFLGLLGMVHQYKRTHALWTHAGDKKNILLTLTICECSKTCILIYWCIVCKFGKYHHVHTDKDETIFRCNRLCVQGFGVFMNL